jgi:4-diphosphocytidyl-2-C-methyl-D-erythritol kinase
VKVSTLAPAKINWTLEVLGRRPDGYHEVRTVLQTVDLCDRVRVSPAADLELALTGPVGQAGPPAGRAGAPLTGAPPSENLAYRAAALLQDRAGRPALGARIELEKAIPAGAGLGGGSSDAAATLRALDRLWGLGLPLAELARLSARLGADVPFFLFGGTALGRGRGDEVTPLPDAPLQRFLLVVPRHRPARKTAAMYAHLRPEHFSGGEASERLAAAISRGVAPRDDDIFNTFEGIAAKVLPEAAAAAERCQGLGLRPHLAGSGPAQFVLLRPDTESAHLWEALSAAVLEVFEATTVVASAATAVVEEP